MPVIDISAVNSKLIGVCCVQGEERELIRKMWDQRFSKYAAFFVDAAAGDSAMLITQRIYQEIAACGFHTLAGMNVILGVFLDLREEPEQKLLESTAGVANMLSTALGCMVQLRYTFGYAGSQGEKRQGMVQTVRNVIQADSYSNGLILTADSVFGGEPENRWKSVMLYLDMLRRSESAGNAGRVSHHSGTVGFLRYGEFDHNQHERLADEAKTLSQGLTDDGKMPFSNRLSTNLNDLELEAGKRFEINPAMQPLHPNMIVEGPINRMRAAGNMNEDFNRARRATTEAVMKTGARLKDQVMEFFLEKIGDPREYLVCLLKEAQAGIGFVANRALVKAVLEQQIPAPRTPTAPSLTYNRANDLNVYIQEIGVYLNDVLHFAVYLAKKEVLSQLSAVYAAMTDESFAKARADLQKKLEVVQLRQTHILTKSAFCNIAIGNGMGLESPFFTFMGAANDVTLKYLVCRETADRQFLNSLAVVDGECRYYINETTGGLVELDNASIKAVQAALFDATDERLANLFM